MIQYLTRVLCLLCCALPCVAQLAEDFGDGDLQNPPHVWTGGHSLPAAPGLPFIVNAQHELQSQPPAGGSGTRRAYASTPLALHFGGAVIEWQARIRTDFGLSSATLYSSNHPRLYIAAQSADLNGDLNGYFVQVGQQITLHRQQGAAVATLALSGGQQFPVNFPCDLQLRIVRQPDHQWEIWANGALVGRTQDQALMEMSHTGVQVRWSADSRRNGFYFDDLRIIRSVPADLTPPQVQEAVLVTPTQIRVRWSEEVQQDTSYYAMDGQRPHSAMTQAQDRRQVLLDFVRPFRRGQPVVLHISGARDLAANVQAAAWQQSFVLPAPGQVVFNEICADPARFQGFVAGEWVEIQNMSAMDVALGGWTFADASRQAVLPACTLPAQGRIVLGRHEDSVTFRANGVQNFVGIATNSQWPSLNNSGDLVALRDPWGAWIDSLSYSSSWYGTGSIGTLEAVSLANPCLQGASNWRASTHPDGGTPGQQNAVFNPIPDQTPPVLRQVRVQAPNRVLLTFDGPMDTAWMRLPDRYQVSGGALAAPAVQIAADRSTVQLTFGHIAPGQPYQMRIADARDCSANSVQTIWTRFGIAVGALRHDLLLHEIMADPSPVVQLPETEWIEIYNASGRVLALDSLWLADGSGQVRLPAAVVWPEEYLLLAPTAAVGSLQRYGRVIGVPNFPSLSNTGERLVLQNRQGHVVHQVAYQDTWYGDLEKKDGGWTLEMIDRSKPCSGQANWRASEDPAGGTPGLANSVEGRLSDQRPPILIEVLIESPQSLLLLFDEPLDPGELLSATIELSGAAITARQLVPTQDGIRLSLATALQFDAVYILTTAEIADCPGNLSPLTRTKIVRPHPAAPGDVVINEILFNPVTGGVDFVELYNRSSRYIDLRGWQMANAGRDGLTDQKRVIADKPLTLFPGAYLVLTPDPDLLRGQYPGSADSTFLRFGLPSYNDDAGSVRLLNPADSVVEQVDYDEEWHFRLLDEVEGVSLERISPDVSAARSDHWKSAASRAGYGTPGYLNSQHLNGVGEGSQCFAVDPLVITPDGDGVQDFTTLRFDCGQHGFVANIRIFDAQGRLVRTLVHNHLLATSGFYQWDGTSDEGRKAPVGYYIIAVDRFDLSGQVHQQRLKVVVGPSAW